MEDVAGTRCCKAALIEVAQGNALCGKHAAENQLQRQSVTQAITAGDHDQRYMLCLTVRAMTSKTRLQHTRT